MKYHVYVRAHSDLWHSVWCIILYVILELMGFSESYLQINFKKELQEPGYSQVSGTNQYSIQTAF